MQEIRADVLSDSSSTSQVGSSTTTSGSLRPGSGGLTTTQTDTFETIRTINYQNSQALFKTEESTTKQNVG